MFLIIRALAANIFRDDKRGIIFIESSFPKGGVPLLRDGGFNF